MKKIGKGKVIEELVKGSMEYTMSLINQAFRALFPYQEDGLNCYIAEIFDDHVIVTEYGSSSPLKTDEYYKVTYSKADASSAPDGSAQREYVFAARDQWEIVELTYQPQTVVTESKKKSGKRFEEAIAPSHVRLLEAKDESKGTRRIRINGFMVANVVNGNNRLYESAVIEALVADWRSHLHESAGQGRLKILTGEVEHPITKGKKQTEYLETVVRWDTLDWNGERLDIEGDLILTSKGKDVEILMEAGVNPGGSVRGIGESKIEKVKGEKVERMLWISMTGADLVGDPSFKNAAELQESNHSQGDDEMLEELKKLLAEHPELFGKGFTETQLVEMSEAQLKKIEESIRTKLGIDTNADLAKALDETLRDAKAFKESQKQAEVKNAIKEATKDLPFGKELNAAFVDSLNEAELTTPEAVKKFTESKYKEYGKLASKKLLVGMGWDESRKSVKIIGNVLETETGTPEFARASFEISESLRKSEMRSEIDLRKRQDRGAMFAMLVLECFDKKYFKTVDERGQPAGLYYESQRFEEAELTTDLNLPYSVSRTIIPEVIANLVAANVFDMGIMEQTPTKIFYEAFTGETGYSVDVVDELETSGAEEVWYDLANKNIVPGTVVVTSNPAGTTYVEGTDFVIDYEYGKIKHLAAGAVGANDVLVTYTYHATRKGENTEIERAKVSLSSQTIEASAMRLADYISHEAIVFSRSQLGWDAVTRTMANLIRQIRLDIDKTLIEKALAAALAVASNSGGTWDISDADYTDLVKKLGVASVKVANRYYQPTSILCSVTNAERLSNWTGFQRDGFPNALLSAAGFANMIVKGLPVFATTQMRDTWFLVMNREIVMHRVFQPMTVKGPFPTYSNGKLVAAEQYYAEEYNASLAPIGGKAAYVLTQA